MILDKNIKAIFKELGSVFAGFKIALIVIAYFGFGSVAKWCIEQWYPFTRWVWDKLCMLITIPPFPDVIKDSLTALVFFIPLGIAVLIQIFSKSKNYNVSHRALGACFGITFLFLICKDVLSSIAEGLASIAPRAIAENPFVSFIDDLSKFFINIPNWVLVLLALMYIFTFGFVLFSRKRMTNIDIARQLLILLKRRNYLIANIILHSTILVIIFGYSFAQIAASDTTFRPIAVAFLIMLIILVLIVLAVIFIPRKLYVTMGVAIAFISMALAFDIFLIAKRFIESATV